MSKGHQETFSVTFLQSSEIIIYKIWIKYITIFIFPKILLILRIKSIFISEEFF